eukprot:jgi/Chrzof1/646/Cz01g23190.t1
MTGLSAADNLLHSLTQLYESAHSTEGPLILDSRPAQAYGAHRLQRSVNIPEDQLIQRCFLLPDKAEPFHVVLPSPTDFQVTDAQDQDGKALDCGATLVYLRGTTDLVTFLSSRGWQVHTVLHDSVALWQAASSLGRLETGPIPKRRWLFAPSKLLKDELCHIEQHLQLSLCPATQDGQQRSMANDHMVVHACLSDVDAHTQAALPQDQSLRFRALDIGCGSGRDAVWLACREAVYSSINCGTSKHAQASADCSGLTTASGNITCSWQVTAVDAWLGALQRAHELAAHAGLTDDHLQLLYGKVDAGSGELQLLPLPEGHALESHVLHSALQVASTCSDVDSTKHDDHQPPHVCTHTAQDHVSTASPIAMNDHSQQQCKVTPNICDTSSAAFDVLGDGWHVLSHHLCRHGSTVHVGSSQPSCCSSYHLVMCMRFLERSLLSVIPNLLVCGGFVAYCTFVDGEGLRQFGRPSGPEHVLQPGELANDWFGPAQGFRVARDDIVIGPDGREFCFFVAQKLK